MNEAEALIGKANIPDGSNFLKKLNFDEKKVEYTNINQELIDYLIYRLINRLDILIKGERRERLRGGGEKPPPPRRLVFPTPLFLLPPSLPSQGL